MTSYWFSDPCALFNSFSINPLSGTDKNFQYNSLTRLIIISTLVAMYAYPDQINSIAGSGLFSVMVSVCIYFLTLNSTSAIEERIIDPKGADFSKEEYSAGLTEYGKDILEDYETNTKNSFLINHPRLNTDDLKNKLFMNGNKTPKRINKEFVEPIKGNEFSQQVMTGTVKQLNSLQSKNISPV
jgi:hypothetical protein